MIKYLLERVLPEVNTALLNSYNHPNRTYKISITFLTENKVQIEVFITKFVATLDLSTGIEESPSYSPAQNSLEEVNKLVSGDLGEFVESYHSAKGKYILTLFFKEGYYSHCEENCAEHRQKNKGKRRKHDFSRR